jgi:hypothetical protein
MKTSSRRAWALPTWFVLLATLAHAHPGHDGHDFTWDFGHLAQHPFATMGCAAAVGAATCVAFQWWRRPSARDPQSFRGSQANRGK